MCRVWIDGVPPGRQPRATDCATARANVPGNGRVIYGNNRGRGSNRDDCTYSQTTNTVSDIIFGRSGRNTTNCRDNGNSRVDGGWYSVGRDNNGDTIYERRTRDSNGNVIIQRARRDVFGNLSIIGTRNAGNDGTWGNNRRHGDDDDEDDDENGGWNGNRRHGDDNEHGDNENGRGRWKKDGKDNRGHGKHHDD